MQVGASPAMVMLWCLTQGATTGDSDCVSNIIHLALAKTQDGKAGTAGINCLMVSNFWVDDDGNITKWNDVTTVGIEHKMGIHGSATCTLAFSENNDCYGWMIGDGPVDSRTWQRAKALISIAHPGFRAELIQEAEK